MKNKLKKLMTKTINNNRGLTLIELMIVIAIIGIIMGIVGTNVMGRFQKAKVETTKIQIKQLGVILQDFKRDCGFYPTMEQGLMALKEKPAGKECKNYDPEGYISKNQSLPKDGFGNEFIYTSDGNKYTIISQGADGKEGGAGNDQDLSSDQLD